MSLLTGPLERALRREPGGEPVVDPFEDSSRFVVSAELVLCKQREIHVVEREEDLVVVDCVPLDSSPEFPGDVIYSVPVVDQRSEEPALVFAEARASEKYLPGVDIALVVAVIVAFHESFCWT